MKTSILASIVITGFLAASAAQAATSGPADELYSGMSAAAIQKDQIANPAAERQSRSVSPTCPWREAKAGQGNFDPLYVAYPGEGYHEHEKAYFSPANMENPVC